MKKLAIVITHPIQYYVPVFRLLAKECELKVFYTWGEGGIKAKHDPGFGKTIAWDLPLLDGYEYELLKNTAKEPGSHHGKGIINPEIIYKIEAFQPNAILVYGYMYQSHFKVMRYFKGKTPVWFRGDSTLLDQQSAFKSIVKKLYLKWVYSFVDKVFYVGTHNKAYFKEYGLKESQLFFAPHAIDNERFSADRNGEVEKIKHDLGIKKEDVLVLFAGKLEPKKNPMLLLEAFINLRNEQRTTNNDNQTQKVHLLFVGNGILEEKLKVRARRYFDKLSMTTFDKKSRPIEIVNRQSSIVNPIHFLDFQNQTQMPVVYQACDIFCLPSEGPGETWGLAINEAMAAGKAIIASDKVGCAVDLVKEGKNGYVFKSNDAEDLQEKLLLLIKDPNRLTNFGKSSREIIQHWSFEKQVEQLVKALNKI